MMDNDPDGMKQYGGSPNRKTAMLYDRKIKVICEAIDEFSKDGQMCKHDKMILDGIKGTLKNMSLMLHDKVEYILPRIYGDDKNKDEEPRFDSEPKV